MRWPTPAIAALAITAGPILSAAGGSTAGGRGRSALQSAAAVRPDVVILLTDQQRGDAFGAGGSPEIRTPTMDRLAREGVLFTRAFVATPQCSPSRAALLTGWYPHRTGVMGNTGGEGAEQRGRAASTPEGMSTPLNGSLPTLGHVFAAAGYQTAYFGKWHLGLTPGEYGFEVHDSKIDDSTLARRVVGFLQSRASAEPRRPLLLIVSWLNPHDVYGALKAKPDARLMESARLPSNLIDPLDDKPFPQRHYLQEDQGRPFVGAGSDVWRRYRAFYNGLVEKVDREIGTVVDAFQRPNAPPIIVFSSDHGDLGGAHGLPFKGPAMYDELVRVPLVISWPGRIRPAASDALVSMIDLMPTLCDLSGVTAPAGDGLSLRPLVEDRLRDWRRDMIFSEYYGKQSWRVPIRMVRTSRWKYVRYVEYGEELYDLDADPGELRNLAREPRAASAASAETSASKERTRLARALDDWIKRTADPFPRLTVTDRAGRVVAPR